MKKSLYALLIIFGILLIGSLSFQESFALTCSGPTWDEEFERQDIVFTGKVISKEYLPTNDEMPFDHFAISTIQVENTIKGTIDDTVKIKSDESFWGIILNEDWRYLIFGSYRSDDFLAVQICTNSGLLPPVPDQTTDQMFSADQRLSELTQFLSDKNLPPLKLIQESPKISEKHSPKKQLELGIKPQNVECKLDFKLIFKISDSSPACVKPKTIEKLVERGWTHELQNMPEITEILNCDAFDNLISKFECFFNSWNECIPSQLVHRYITIEGDPIIETANIKKNNENNCIVEIIHDSTEDMWSEKKIQKFTCSILLNEENYLVLESCIPESSFTFR